MKEGKGGRMNKTKEKLSKIKLKYPEIREILQKLYTSAYRSGQAIKDKGDSYDHSTAYEEIEKILDSMREETLGEVEKSLHHKYLKRTKNGEPIFKTATEAQIVRQWDVPFKEGWNSAVDKIRKYLKTKNEKTQ